MGVSVLVLAIQGDKQGPKTDSSRALQKISHSASEAQQEMYVSLSKTEENWAQDTYVCM